MCVSKGWLVGGWVCVCVWGGGGENWGEVKTVQHMHVENVGSIFSDGFQTGVKM